ncbi:MAG TPA: DUF6033 family protein [Opitutales bacterium]|nr:DUF6033 family protein [Opitutales bacterium]
MNAISTGYTSYSSLLGTSAMSRSAAQTSATAATDTTPESYLDQLKNQFSDLNLSAGEYTGGTSGSGVQGNVLVSPKLLARAASDPSVAAKLESDLSGIPQAEEWIANQCAMRGMHLDASGTVIDEDGNMSSWSITTTTVPSGKADDADEKKEEEEERIEKKLEEKAAEERRAMKADSEEALRESEVPVSSYSEYEGAFGALRSTVSIPYSLNVYA